MHLYPASFQTLSRRQLYLVALVCLCLMAARADAAPMPCKSGTLHPVELTDDLITSVGCSIEIQRVARGVTSLAEARKRYAEVGFTPLQAEDFAFGLMRDAFWLTFDVHNPQSNALSVVIDTNRPFLRDLRMWVARDGETTPILVENSARPFTARPSARRLLVTPALPVQPGETLRIWAYAAFDGPATLPISIYPSTMAGEVALRQDAALTVFLSVAVVIFVVVLGFAIALHSTTALFYAAFFAGVLAYNAQLSGMLFKYVWPGSPVWNAVASHHIGLIAVLFALLFAWSFSQTGKARPYLRWAIFGLGSLCIGLMIAPAFLPLVTVKAFAGPIVLGFLAIQLWAATASMVDRIPGRVFFFAGTVILFLYLGAFTVSSQIEAVLGTVGGEYLLRFGQLFDGIVFCLAVFRQTSVLRTREVDARILSAQMASQMASIKHDLRQPLLSIRAAIDRLGQDSGAVDTQTRETLADSLSHLYALVEKRAGTSMHTPEPELQGVPLGSMLDNVAFMFAEDAVAKGITLNVVKTRLMAQADAVDLFRVLTNLVSNAIRHSNSDRIVTGVRRRGSHLSLHVVDRGDGLAPDATGAGTLPDSEGLGLGIVREICARNGWDLLLESTSQQGTHVQIGNIPLVSAQ